MYQGSHEGMDVSEGSEEDSLKGSDKCSCKVAFTGF